MHDLNTKKAAYEGFGVLSYWVVVPDPLAPSVLAFELRAGRYELGAQALGDELFHANRPFPIDIQPSRLVSGLGTHEDRASLGNPPRANTCEHDRCDVMRAGRNRGVRGTPRARDPWWEWF